MRKIISILFYLILLCFAFVGCTADISAVNEDIFVTAEQLWTDIKHGDASSLSKYEGKRITVTGIVAESASQFLGSPCILLENGVDSIPDGIFCMFFDDAAIGEYNIGQSITVCGVCSLGTHIAGDDTNPYIFIKEAQIQK